MSKDSKTPQSPPPAAAGATPASPFASPSFQFAGAAAAASPMAFGGPTATALNFSGFSTPPKGGQPQAAAQTAAQAAPAQAYDPVRVNKVASLVAQGEELVSKFQLDKAIAGLPLPHPLCRSCCRGVHDRVRY
jgi:hypothetical protein